VWGTCLGESLDEAQLSFLLSFYRGERERERKALAAEQQGGVTSEWAR
jgi:hypothetical protein